MTADDPRPPLTESVLVHRQWVAAHATTSTGVSCSLCGRLVKRYQRSVNRGQVKSLARIYQLGGTTEPVLAAEQKVCRRSSEEGKLRYFGLLEPDRSRRPDGGSAGLWWCTELGEAFLHGRATIPKYCAVFNKRVLGFYGPQVDVHHCYQSRFDLREALGVIGWNVRQLPALWAVAVLVAVLLPARRGVLRRR